jgi:ABC-type polysaccharide/polyol phosphate transport system ATPase subunit
VSAAAVSVRNLSKRFKLYRNPWDRIFEWASLGTVRRHDEFWALRDVSFEVRQGECLGIVASTGRARARC